MIDIPVYDNQGKQVDTLQLDEQVLGGEVRPQLLKQAYVRSHANRRLGTSKTKTRSETSYSTRKMYRQKGTGNARRGDRNANILVGGARAFGKRPRDFRQDMPRKMRRLANRNAILAKVVDGELKLIDKLSFDKPSTKAFSAVLEALKIDRNVLVALTTTRGFAARSAANFDGVSLTRVDQLNAFEILNHRYLLAEKDAFVAWLDGKIDAQAKTGAAGSAAAVNGEAA